MKAIKKYVSAIFLLLLAALCLCACSQTDANTYTKDEVNALIEELKESYAAETEADLAALQAKYEAKLAALEEKLNQTSQDHTHVFDEWTCMQENVRSCENEFFFRFCSECSAMEWKKGTYAEHRWASRFSYNEYQHWIPCENCEVTQTPIAHLSDTQNEKCSECEIVLRGTEGLQYTLSEDGTFCIVTGYSGSEADVVIPDYYQSRRVQKIGEQAFYDCASADLIRSVYIPGSVTVIGTYAFTSTPIRSVHISNGTTHIEEVAFVECPQLESVSLPASVTYIGGGAFSACPSLTSFNVSAENETFCTQDGNLYNKAENTLVQYLIGKTDESFAIPEGTKGIALGAFFGCQNLKSVTVPSSITVIGESAFVYCDSLESIEFLGNLTTIGMGAFMECSSLTSISIPNTVTTIEGSAFMFCSGLESVTIPDSVTSVGNDAFAYCSNLTSVIIGSGVTEIGARAFGESEALTSVQFKNPAGWQIREDYGEWCDVAEEDLKNTSTAADYLQKTHPYATWKRG